MIAIIYDLAIHLLLLSVGIHWKWADRAGN
jgi:hypothetical protein